MVRVVDRGPGHPAGAAGARVRALLPRRHRPHRAPRLRASASRSCAGSSRRTAGACGSSRCRTRARPSRSSCRSSSRRTPSRPRTRRLPPARGRDATPTASGCSSATTRTQILRALRVVLREAGLRRRAGIHRRRGARRWPRCRGSTRRSSTSCCPTATASRSPARSASGPRCRSWCCRRSARRTRRCARSRRARTTT